MADSPVKNRQQEDFGFQYDKQDNQDKPVKTPDCRPDNKVRQHDARHGQMKINWAFTRQLSSRE